MPFLTHLCHYYPVVMVLYLQNTSFKEAADKAVKKGSDLSAIVTGDLLND